MTEKVKITKLLIEISKTQVELTLEEAKELYEQLGSLFGKEIEYVPSMPIVIEKDRWHPPYQPTWIDRTDIKYPSTTEIICSTSGGSGLSVSYCGSLE